jgi:hypothetical protein
MAGSGDLTVGAHRHADEREWPGGGRSKSLVGGRNFIPDLVSKVRTDPSTPDPPARPPPSGGSGPYTYEPCDDVDPMPDCENVLAD